jgi:hypothetical protein
MIYAILLVLLFNVHNKVGLKAFLGSWLLASFSAYVYIQQEVRLVFGFY